MSERELSTPEVTGEPMVPVAVVAAIYSEWNVAGVVKGYLFEDGLLIFPNPQLQRTDSSNAWLRIRRLSDKYQIQTEVIMETELPATLYDGVSGEHPVIDITTNFPGFNSEAQRRFDEAHQRLEGLIDRRKYWHPSQWPPSASAEIEILEELGLD